MNRVFLLLVLVGLALGLWWFLGTDLGTTAKDPVAEAQDQVAELSPGTFLAEPKAKASGALNEISREKILEDALARTEVNLAAKGAQVTVVTLARNGGQPLANAEVWLFPGESGDSLARLRSERDLFDSLFQRMSEKGLSRFSDTEGKIAMTIPQGNFFLVAKWRDLYEEVYRNQAGDGDTIWLQLHNDHDLRVRVQDERGQPLAHFPLALDLQVRNSTYRIASFSADANGLASLDHVEARLPSNDPGSQLILRAEAPFRETPELEIPLDPFPEELIFQVPPYASVTVIPRLANGEEGWSEPTFLQRHQTEPSDWAVSFGIEPEPALGMGKVDAFHGEAPYQFVGLGLELDAGVLFGQGRRPTVKTFSGPLQAGENLRVEVQEVHDRPILQFRAVNEAGEPYANADVNLFFRMSNGHHTSDRINLDAQGRGQCPVPIDGLGAMSEWIAIQFDLPVISRDLLAEVTLRPVPSPGPVDLGDIVFAKGPLLCAGRVVNRLGEAVQGARLRVFYEGSRGEKHLVNRQIYAVDEEGSFAIFGDCPSGKLLLAVYHSSYPDQEIEVLTGSDRLSLVMEEGFRVSGTARFEEGIDPTRLSAVLAPPNLPSGFRESYRDWPSAPLQRDGSFAILTLDSTLGQALLVDRGSGAILSQIPQVTPWLVSTAGDLRLQQWDMRGKVFRFGLSFRDPQGLPANDLNLRFTGVASLAEETFSEITFRNGFGEVYLPQSQCDFVAIGRGARSLEESCREPGDYAFTMNRGIPIRIQLDSAQALPNNARIGMSLEHMDHPERSSYYDALPFDEQGALELFVPESGVYRAVLSVGFALENEQSVTLYFPDEEEAPLRTIADQATAQSFVFAIDAAALEAAIQAEQD